MSYAIDLYVCLSVRLSVWTQERLGVESWNLAQLWLRSRVTWSLKMGHVHDLWPGQIANFHNVHSECMWDCTVYNLHVRIPVEYLYICATAVYSASLYQVVR